LVDADPGGSTERAGEVPNVRRSKRSLTVVALVAALSLVLVACGGGDDDDSSSTTSSSGPAAPAGTLTIGAE
jgi:hypothetical protein